MTQHWILPEALFDGAVIRRDVAVSVRDGVVDGLVPVAKAPKAKAHKVAGLVTPGYLDLQVNGGGGVQLNQTPTRQGITDIVAAHRRFGTVGILPTVITDTPEVLQAAVDAALAAKDDPGVLGLHIEGPHISLARRGTHAERYVRRFDDDTLQLVRRLRDAGVRVMITVAPEAATTDDIAALAATGAIVSIGHTDAPAGDIYAALDAGARCGTHLFNAMSPMLNRSPGAVGALINSKAYTGVICDSHHVADEMVALAWRARPVADRMFLVSDAMATVGGPDQFNLYGDDIRLTGGKLINAEGSLAGAHVTQAEGVQGLVQRAGLPVEAALRMAVTVPANLLDAPELAQVTGRNAADLLILDDNLAVRSTMHDVVQGLSVDHVAE